MTTAPGSYAFQPDDDTATFLTTSAKTLTLSPFVPISYSWQVVLQNYNTATTVTPLGGVSTLNNSTSATTLTAAYKSVFIWSIGTSGSGNARFLLSQ